MKDRGQKREPNSSGMRTIRSGVVVLAAVAGLLVAGCSSVPSTEVELFSGGVSEAREQMVLSFKVVNEISRDSMIEYAVSRPTLSDSNLVVALDSGVLRVWEAAFDGLQLYGRHLLVLASSATTRDFRNSAVDLGRQVQRTGGQLGVVELIPTAPDSSPALAVALTRLGETMIRVKAQSDARKVMEEADPDVRKILVTMADAIGTTSTKGVRGTVRAHWMQLKGEKQVAFLAPNANKRALVVGFLNLTDRQEAGDDALASLERSLRSLADAHHALAAGHPLDAMAAITLMSAEIEETRDLLETFRNTRPGTN